MHRPLSLLAAALCLSACSAGAPDDAPPRSTDSAAAVASTPAANADEPGGVDSLEMANVQLMRERQESMAGYTECMAQAAGAPAGARQRIEQACARLRDAPK